MAAGSTYTPIATTTLGSATASYTFSSIPSTYTDLVVVAVLTGTPNGINPQIEYNGDTGSNYSLTWVRGNGSAASSTRYSNQTSAYLGYIRNDQPSPIIINIENYANTTTYKTCLFRWNTAGDEVGAGVALWRSTAAINAVKIKSANPADSFTIGSTFTLYGIAAA